MSPRPRPEAPLFRLGPARERYSNRTRLALAVILAVLLVAAIVGAVLLVADSKPVPGRVVAIPAADRTASPDLLRAAAAVGFHSTAGPGMGQIENEPARSAQASGAGLLAVGSPAPAFTLRTPEGVPVSLGGLRGKVVLLEFFATWCPHCAAEAPHVERLYRSLAGKKVAFVAVNADGEDAASILAYHIYFGLGFPALLDPSSNPGSFHSPGSPGQVSHAYRIGTYPTFYVLDARGRIVWRSEGEQPDAALRAELRQAAGGPAAPKGTGAGGTSCTAGATGCTSP